MELNLMDLPREMTEIRQQPLVQRLWELSLVSVLLGLFLLLARMLGSWLPAVDPWFQLGVIWGYQGLHLSGFGLLYVSHDRWKIPEKHFRGWSVLQFIAVCFTTLAMLPMNSLAVVCFSLPGIVAIGLLPLRIQWDNACNLEAENMPASTEPEGISDANQQELTQSAEKPSALQWQSRKRTEENNDCLEGMLQVEFFPGQTTCSAHVAISPAFAQRPEIECEPLNCDNIEILVDTVYAHGFRLDLRRTSGKTEAQIVEVGFQAVAELKKSVA